MSDIDELVWRCQACLHIYRDVNIHENHYSSGEYRKTHQIIDKAKRDLWITNILNKFGYIFDPDKSVLEIGSGDGMFCRHIITRYNSMVASCELDPNLIQLYSWKSYVGNFLTINILDEYDITVSFDVLEHFKNPKSFVDKLRSETVLLQTPIDRAIISPKKFADTHYHYFSLKSISKLMKSKYKLVDYYHSGRGFSANGPELLTLFRKIT